MKKGRPKKNNFRYKVSTVIENEIREIFHYSLSKSDVCRALNVPINGQGIRLVNEFIEKYDIDISHFDKGKSKRTKYIEVEKECPVCGMIFITRKGHPREKTTCSYSCSNSHFRKGTNNGSWKDESYRSTCFHYHKKECVVCGEKNAVSVHHYDSNRDNNEPENLIPICPNHHQYIHSNFDGRDMVIDEINKYRNEFLKK